MASTLELAKAVITLSTEGLAKVGTDIASLKINLASLDGSALATKKTLDNLKGNPLLPMKGFDDVKNALASVSNNMALIDKQGAAYQKRLQDIREGFQKMGQVATLGFVAATAGITAFFRTASPKGFDDLQFALFRLSLQLGRVFVPLVNDVTRAINNLADWFKNLDDDTRENLLTWTKWTVIGLAAGTVLGKIVAIGGTVITVVKGIGSAVLWLSTTGFASLASAARMAWAAMAFLVANPVLLAIVALTTAVAALSYAFFSVGTNIDTTIANILKMEAEMKRLKEGGALGQKEVKELIPSDVRILLNAAKTVDERKKILDDAIAKQEEKVKANPTGEQQESKALIMKKILEAMNEDVKSKSGFLQDTLEKVLPADSIRGKARQDILKKVGGIPEAQLPTMKELAPRELPQETINKIETLISSQGKADEQTLQALKSLKEQGGKAIDNDRFRGERLVQAPQLLGIADAWKKMQQSMGETLEARKQRELLEETKKSREANEETAKNTKNLPRGLP